MPFGSFNPSYGLHALRALNPRQSLSSVLFQSLIWVACPTGSDRPHDQPDRGVSIPHMGCMPYGLKCLPIIFSRCSVSIPHMGCMPYGRRPSGAPMCLPSVSIPHMGCMPYGQSYEHDFMTNCVSFNPSYGLHALRALMATTLYGVQVSFNPSYGLHALRAFVMKSCSYDSLSVSIPHMGCMPYGLGFKSDRPPQGRVSIPHMGCMPYGRCYHVDPLRPSSFNPSYGLHALRATPVHQGDPLVEEFQSLIWVACPTGQLQRPPTAQVFCCFNPSYGLHALRAAEQRVYELRIVVSIPHMGCMPYGPGAVSAHSWGGRRVSIPHMGCMPYGPISLSLW